MNSIEHTKTEVQNKASNASTNTIGHKAIIKRTPEGILADIEDDVLNASLNRGKPLIAKELKQYVSFRALMEADGHRLQTSGTQVKCCCPFHPDKTPSFSIFDTDDCAKCYGCGWYGDIFKYEQEFHEVDFRGAWKNLNAFLRAYPRTGKKAKALSKTVKVEEPAFTPKQLKERKTYAARLANESWLAEKVCVQRSERTGEKWSAGIVQGLGKEGSLGWAGDGLAFMYPGGTKYRRWPEKEFYWECEYGSLWRGELLAGAKHVYLTESETDAIAWLHTGIEDKPGTAVIAVSGAGNFQSEWAPRFKGKVVTLCFDNDKAGEDGANKTGLFLKPFVSELLIHELGGAK